MLKHNFIHECNYVDRVSFPGDKYIIKDNTTIMQSYFQLITMSTFPITYNLQKKAVISIKVKNSEVREKILAKVKEILCGYDSIVVKLDKILNKLKLQYLAKKCDVEFDVIENDNQQLDFELYDEDDVIVITLPYCFNMYLFALNTSFTSPNYNIEINNIAYMLAKSYEKKNILEYDFVVSDLINCNLYNISGGIMLEKAKRGVNFLFATDIKLSNINTVNNAMQEFMKQAYFEDIVI